MSALMFLNILSSLMFGTDADIGLDPHYEVNEVTSKVAAITVDDKHFEVKKMIYSLDSLVGQGTQVWIVKHNSCFFVLKDFWIQSDRVESKKKFLTAISTLPDDNIKNFVPTIICGGDVIIDGIPDNTGHYRSGLVGVLREQVHCRMFCLQVSEPLYKFRTKKEFISALIDVICGGLFNLFQMKM